MKKSLIVVAGAWMACASAVPMPKGETPVVPVSPRIGVLDLGLGAGTGKGAFGCPSDPAVFQQALAPLGEVTTISGEDAARKDILTRKNIDLLDLNQLNNNQELLDEILKYGEKIYDKDR